MLREDVESIIEILSTTSNDDCNDIAEYLSDISDEVVTQQEAIAEKIKQNIDENKSTAVKENTSSREEKEKKNLDIVTSTNVKIDHDTADIKGSLSHLSNASVTSVANLLVADITESNPKINGSIEKKHTIFRTNEDEFNSEVVTKFNSDNDKSNVDIKPSTSNICNHPVSPVATISKTIIKSEINNNYSITARKSRTIQGETLIVETKSITKTCDNSVNNYMNIKPFLSGLSNETCSFTSTNMSTTDNTATHCYTNNNEVIDLCGNGKSNSDSNADTHSDSLSDTTVAKPHMGWVHCGTNLTSDKMNASLSNRGRRVTPNCIYLRTGTAKQSKSWKNQRTHEQYSTSENINISLVEKGNESYTGQPRSCRESTYTQNLLDRVNQWSNVDETKIKGGIKENTGAMINCGKMKHCDIYVEDYCKGASDSVSNTEMEPQKCETSMAAVATPNTFTKSASTVNKRTLSLPKLNGSNLESSFAKQISLLSGRIENDTSTKMGVTARRNEYTRTNTKSRTTNSELFVDLTNSDEDNNHNAKERGHHMRSSSHLATANFVQEQCHLSGFYGENDTDSNVHLKPKAEWSSAAAASTNSIEMNIIGVKDNTKMKPVPAGSLSPPFSLSGLSTIANSVEVGRGEKSDRSTQSQARRSSTRSNLIVDLDDENFEQESKPSSNLSFKTTYDLRTKHSRDDSTDSDSEESDAEYDDYGRRSVKKRKRCKASSNKLGVKILPKRTPSEINFELDKIDNIYAQNQAWKNEHPGVPIPEESMCSLPPLVCKFLICVMWDFDLRYILLPHQYEGVLAVAGVDVDHLQQKLLEYKEDDAVNNDNYGNGCYIMRRSKMFSLFEEGKELREKIIKDIKFVNTGGVILADDMGLGKTIQGLGGAILRTAIIFIRRGRSARKLKPTVIVGPNDTVLKQWEETLLQGCGIPHRRIKYYHKNDKMLRQGNAFVLLTRYELMVETRELLENKQGGDCNSYLFPKISNSLKKKLWNQYNSSKGNERNLFKHFGETPSQCVARLLRESIKAGFKEAVIRTFLIDESHYLKNVVSFWGIGAAILGMCSERVVPLSGTPYNNGPQDMATQMVFIDPTHEAGNVDWWRNATEGGRSDHVAKQIREWKDRYMIRRNKSILSTVLPPKISETCKVRPYPLELPVYLFFEGCFMKVLGEFAMAAESLNLHADPDVIQRTKEMYMILMARMTQMRASLIHPIIPGGREITIQFSPSRRHLLYSYASKKCVCCMNFPLAKKEDPETEEMDEDEVDEVLADVDASEDDEDLVDGGFGNSSSEKRVKERAKRRNIDLGQLVVIDATLCNAPEMCRHYIHEECLQRFLNSGEDKLRCPLCEDLEDRMRIDSKNAEKLPYNTYCTHISCGPCIRGIKATAKIQEVVDWGMEVPKEDKAIIYSFFKGSLDLLEGIFVDDFGIDCARFDGDLRAELRAKELNRFRTTKKCRFLLASVQSGGVGLNIVEANHVAFLDRWFNPCVHSQAEDRCYRLKQKKKTFIRYFDVNMTVDEVMKSINTLKMDNATILLSDGTQIGSSAQSNISYKELSGTIGNLMKSLSSTRRRFQEAHSPNVRLPSIDEVNSQQRKSI